MHICPSVSDAYENCFSSKTFSITRFAKHPLRDLTFPSDFYSIFYSYSCQFDIIIHNQIYHIASNSVLIIRPFEFYHFIPSLSGAVNGHLFFIHPQFLSNLSDYRDDWLQLFNAESPEFKHVRLLSPSPQKLFNTQLRQIYESHGFGAALKTNHACIEFLLALYSLYAVSPPGSSDNFASLSYTFSQPFASILSFINQNLNENINVNDIAAHYYISPSYLCRLFRTQLGISANFYLNAQKVCHAKKLLYDGLPVRQCYVLCGYREYNTFLHAFKKYSGCTPTQFLSQIKPIAPKLHMTYRK